MGKISKTKVPAADGGGLRFNAGKIRIELLPTEWIWGLADVMTKGSYKYEQRNWERGMSWGNMVGCSTRHLFKFLMGERYDPDAEYVREHVPELRGADPATIHAWPDLDDDERAAAAPDYPAPVVDHAERREAAIEAFRAARGE